jgi:hypothetical protein
MGWSDCVPCFGSFLAWWPKNQCSQPRGSRHKYLGEQDFCFLQTRIFHTPSSLLADLNEEFFLSPLRFSCVLRIMSEDSDSQRSDSDSDMDSSPVDNPPAPRQITLHSAKHTTTGRVVDTIPAPANKKLSRAEVFDERGTLRADVIKAHFILEGRLEEDVVLEIISRAEKLLAAEPNLLEVAAPCTGPLVFCDLPFFPSLSPGPLSSAHWQILF